MRYEHSRKASTSAWPPAGEKVESEVGRGIGIVGSSCLGWVGGKQECGAKVLDLFSKGGLGSWNSRVKEWGRLGKGLAEEDTGGQGH